MPNTVVIHPSGFTIVVAGKEWGEMQLKGERNRLSLLVALISRHPNAMQGVLIEEIWRHHLFSTCTKLESFKHALRHYAQALSAELVNNERNRWINIAYGKGVPVGTVYLRIAPDTTIQLDSEVQRLLDQPSTKSLERWQTFPVHERGQLRDFATSIYKAASQFDKGDAKAAIVTLVPARHKLTKPEYRAVVLLRLGRARLRFGDEEKAEDDIRTAIKLIEDMQEMDRDPILIARAEYHRAWLEYTQGNFSYQPISHAERKLIGAGPDDLPHGHIATLRGLLVVKDLEQQYQSYSLDTLTAKAHEALAYFTHAIYLLIRSEDFYGAQEAAWNLAYGLYILGNLPNVVIPHHTGPIGKDAQEIILWIELSDGIGKIHAAGKDSLRNRVLHGSVEMLRNLDLDAAEAQFEIAQNIVKKIEEEAEAEKENNQPRVSIPPREIGRLYEVWVDFYLRRSEQNHHQKVHYQRLACTAYTKAYNTWANNGLETLAINELETRYKLQGPRVTRKKK